MKLVYSVLLLFSVALQSGAQHNEWSFQIPSGIFSFGGSGSASSSFYAVSDVASIPNYTNNPYGTGSAYSYGLVINFQRITKSNLIFGLQTGYESFSSKLKVDEVITSFQSETVKSGKTILVNQFINFHPFIGKRVSAIKNIDTDMAFGFDFAPCLNSKEHATIETSSGVNYNTTADYHKPSPDFRPRIDLTNYYKKFGFSVGYSYGLTNYTENSTRQNTRVYSRLIRIGVAYRFSP
jgi:cell division protein FtsI/penicillin-binding protein 2